MEKNTITSFSSRLSEINAKATEIINILGLDSSYRIFVNEGDVQPAVDEDLTQFFKSFITLNCKYKFLDFNGEKSKFTEFNTNNGCKAFQSGLMEIEYNSIIFYRFEYMFQGPVHAHLQVCWLVRENDVDTLLDFRNKLFAYIYEQGRERRHVNVYGGRNFSVENLRYTWDDLIISEAVKSSVKSSLDFWYNGKSWYEAHNFPYKRGILIYGNPGNGKTFLTKVIISQYKLNITQFNFMNPNLENADLIDAFRSASKCSPSLFLLEDIDRVFSPQSKNHTNISKDILFNCLDGIDELNGVLIIATANHIDDIDFALIRRPSRFDVVQHLDDPDFNIRYEYLKKLFIKEQIDKAIIENIANDTEGMSMSFLKEIYFKCCVYSSMDNRNFICENDIIKSLDDCIKHLMIAKTAKGEHKTGFGTASKRALQPVNPDKSPPNNGKVIHGF